MNRQRMIALVLMTVLAVAEFAAPLSASQGKVVSFRGWVQADETDTLTPPTLAVDGSGSGLSTHLGPFRFTFHITVDLTTASGPATAVFVAANGDRFFAQGQGQATDLGAYASVVETYTITGGTGWFRGVSGEVTMIRLVTLATGASVGAFDGRLVK